MNHKGEWDQSLYRPEMEHESCGVGFVARTDGKKSHEVIQMGLEVLTKLAHRGATGADPETGDGAGLLIQLPDAFFKREAAQLGISLPQTNPSTYAVGMVFLPKEPNARYFCEGLFETEAASAGISVLGWREVPVVETAVGTAARATCPLVVQVFVSAKEIPSGLDSNNQQSQQGKQDQQSQQALERQLYILRRSFEQAVIRSKRTDLEACYICSLSSQVIVYKGQLLANQISLFYPELEDPLMSSAMAVVHQRYSTNTFPSWKLAHPYRMLAHNGEINTIRGNRQWFKARESLLEPQWFGQPTPKLLPILQPKCSDSGNLDNALEFLCLSGHSLASAMRLLVPQAWRNDKQMPQSHKDFYAYNETIMAPWDGPAALVFTDGKQIGATLDRNGLRPSRYLLTHDNLMVLASETGVLNISDERIARRGKLGPGEMMVLDLETGKLQEGQHLMDDLASAAPYGEWLKAGTITLQNQEKVLISKLSDLQLLNDQQVFGYTEEVLKRVIAPMVDTGREAISSMGNDTPLAVLSTQPKLLFDYFRQLFAQVTNPPIDPIREKSVFSLHQLLGGRMPFIHTAAPKGRFVDLPSPVLSAYGFSQLAHGSEHGLKAITLPMLFEADNGEVGLEHALMSLKTRASEAVKLGYQVIVLSDQGVDRFHAPVPSLLAVSAIQSHLMDCGLRAKADILVCSGEVRDAFHVALLVGFGATAIYPWLLLESAQNLWDTGVYLDPTGLSNQDFKIAQERVLNGLTEGVLKIISKMGITTLSSFNSAGLFEAVGLGNQLVNQYFPGLLNCLPAVELDTLTQETLMRHRQAFSNAAKSNCLDIGGQVHWQKGSEAHLMSPEVIVNLQRACREGDWNRYQAYARAINGAQDHAVTIRSLLTFEAQTPISIDLVASEESLLKRFCTGAMSFGSLSEEVHTTLAIAMNRMGAKSNSGEGGEDAKRYSQPSNGDDRGSAIKQVAAARFGVTADYLVHAQELQIKVAQGAKPGEGGHLPGEKVTEAIAQVRHATPGVTLISPPPHHDIYSIEDLEQLIFDLKSVNTQAKVSVKLVSEAGVGTVAAGVAKGNADIILISGHDGGTGAAPLTAIHSAGMPWEIGLAEAHQTLMLNNLRGRVTLQCDGQMRTGRDVAIAALLGAEAFGFATAPLIVSGCIQMRKCHENTCPVGIATQDPVLRKHFQGKPEHIIQYFKFIVRELREIMASLGVAEFEDLIGRTDFIKVADEKRNWKTKNMDFSQLLYKPQLPARFARFKSSDQPVQTTYVMDRQIAREALSCIEQGKNYRTERVVRNTDRAIGTLLGGILTRRYGGATLLQDTVTLTLQGCAGQSLGAFLPQGVTIQLTGEANDYVAKGLSGGKIALKFPKHQVDDIICGNTVLYGATSGQLYVAGRAGERFAVRNSGAIAVVEGVGDHGCEYMTGGRVAILGSVGKNFAAGMSGGIAYVYDPNKALPDLCNTALVQLSKANKDDLKVIQKMIENHVHLTDSELGQSLLAQWAQASNQFVRVISPEYANAIAVAQDAHVMQEVI